MGDRLAICPSVASRVAMRFDSLTSRLHPKKGLNTDRAVWVVPEQWLQRRPEAGSSFTSQKGRK